MKKILITGAGSYVGGSVERYLQSWPEQYLVDTLDMKDRGWKNHSFRGYDAVLHVAGIVHMEKAKHDPAMADLYDRVNHRLAVETAEKAREDGVKQFVFMSSCSVYGLTAPVGKVVTITKDTPLKPVDHYGRSKAAAEAGLQALAGETFSVAILRPPIIYGKSCKGNYVTMAKLAKKLPLFPYVNNQRSMLYMDNLSELIRLIVDSGEGGIFCPQNNEYTNTSEMVAMIAKANGKHIVQLKGFGWALKLLSRVTPMVDKAFGSLCYDRQISGYPQNYCVTTLEESVIATEH